MSGADKIPAYKDYGRLPTKYDDSVTEEELDSPDWKPREFPDHDGYTLKRLDAWAEYEPKGHFMKTVEAQQDLPEIYARGWKVHIGVQNVHPDVVKTDVDKEKAIDNIGRAWESIRPIIHKYNVAAKVISPEFIGSTAFREGYDIAAGIRKLRNLSCYTIEPKMTRQRSGTPCLRKLKKH